MALLAAAPARSQNINPGFPDPYRLTEPKNFEAFRATSNNEDWNSNDDSKRPIPGETTVLADLQGPGVVTHMWITIADNEYGWPRLLRLRVYYDGSPIPSVDAPLGDFFAVGQGFEAKVKSLMVVNSSDGRARNSYWPMPFQKSCRITVTNEGRRRVSNLYYHVDWEKLPSLPANTPYFHARYRQSLPAPADGSNYEFLNVKGKGHYVGTVLSVVQAEAGWFGEGDEFFWVDGAKKPSIEGTGSEDYFNDAWGLHVNDEPVLRRHGRRGHGPRLAHDGVPLAPARSGAVPEIVEVRHRAQGLDVQRRRLGQIGLRRARGPDVERRVLVPGGHRGGPAARALRRRAPAAGQRPPDRGRARHGGHQVGEGEGLDVPRPLLVQGRRGLRRRGTGLAR